jgi:hypothetical protein
MGTFDDVSNALPRGDVVGTLTAFLQRQTEQERAQSLRPKLSAEDYEQLCGTLENVDFLPPLDAENTKASISYILKKWKR